VQPGPHTDGGVPIVRVADIRDGRIRVAKPLRVSPAVESAYSRTRLRGGELLLTLVGTVGEVAVVPDTLQGWNVARAVAVIPVRDGVGAPWVKLALNAPQVRAMIDGRLNTTVQATLNLKDVAQLPILLPEADERERIYHVLGTLDDKIELHRRMNETLEAIARAIFKSWFVDFDAVRAKASGEPSESICSRLGLTTDPLALFPDHLVDSELGEIPKGWQVRSLATVAALDTTSTSPAAQPDEIFEHYSIPAFDAFAMPTYDLGSMIKSNKYVVSPHGVLVSKLNPETPRVWMPAVKTQRAVCSTEFMQFVPHSRKGRTHLYLMMCSDRVHWEILRRVTGSTGSRQRAQPSQIATLSVLVPTSSLLECFDGFVAPLLGLIARNREQSQTLAAIRDALLPKLLSGELRVPPEGAA
jgi:type I restriction enzyme S subunit